MGDSIGAAAVDVYSPSFLPCGSQQATNHPCHPKFPSGGVNKVDMAHKTKNKPLSSAFFPGSRGRAHCEL